MINKYKNFLLKESILVLEAFLSADSSFLSKLDKMSKKSNTSASIAKLILKNINDEDWVSVEDLKQNFFKAGEERDKVSFIQQNRVKDGIDPYTTPGRTDIKVGRAIKYIANDLYDFTVTDKQVEDFVNVYKSIANEGEPDFQIYEGKDIKKGYDRDNYSNRHAGQLGNSCMTNNFSFLKIYTKNEKIVRLLVLLEDDMIIGRALLWKLDKSPCEAEYFMDRVYTNHDYDVNKFTDYAESSGWLYKKRMSCGDIDAVQFIYKGNEVLGEISVKLDGNHSEYPYLDTLFFLNRERNELSNIPSWKCYMLWDTEGERNRCDECYGKSKNKDLCDDCSEGADLLRRNGIEVDVEKGREKKEKKEEENKKET